MKTVNRIIAALILSLISLLIITSCATLADAAATVGVLTGKISKNQADSIRKTGKAVEKAFEDITPEQEYYIGRSVGAFIMDSYEPYPEIDAIVYLNLLGQSLAMASDRPETFGGYRFLILDSDEINAFATPAGHIFISRGMLRLVKSEEMVAAVLAHEIGHVVHQHGLKAIKTSRWTSAGVSMGNMVTEMTDAGQYDQLTDIFAGTVLDISDTLINSGYSRSQEKEADATAVEILIRVGYDPWALVDLLEEMDLELDPKGLDFAKTHPKPQSRIKDLKKILGRRVGTSENIDRQERFEAALMGI
jgi:predicted Zn-dependent protease